MTGTPKPVGHSSSVSQRRASRSRALRAEGWEVTVVEDTPSRAPVYAERVEAVLAVGAELVEAPTDARVVELVAGVDLVVPSPLVRPGHVAIKAATRRGIAVRSEIDLAAEREGCRSSRSPARTARRR